MRNNVTRWTYAVLAVSLSGLLAFSSQGAAEAPAVHSHDSAGIVHRAPLAVVTSCANECLNYCALTTHHANGAGTSNWGPLHECQGPYTQSCPHPSCDQPDEPEGLADAAAALAPDDVEGLQRILEFSSVSLNLDRAALQFTGCNGEIAAQVDLDPAVASTLAEMTTR